MITVEQIAAVMRDELARQAQEEPTRYYGQGDDNVDGPFDLELVAQKIHEAITRA